MHRALDAVLPISLLRAEHFPKKGKLALTLLVAWVFADHHDHTITADHLALIADRLHARVNLHGLLLLRLLFQWSVITFVARYPGRDTRL